MQNLGKKVVTQQYLMAKLWRAKQYIDANLAEECSVADLAKEVTLSEFHFSRCFKETFGQSPYQYYLTRKLHRSAEMLIETDLDLTSVALEMGFSELSTFSKRFKKLFGMTPQQYKRTARYTGLVATALP